MQPYCASRLSIYLSGRNIRDGIFGGRQTRRLQPSPIQVQRALKDLHGARREGLQNVRRRIMRGGPASSAGGRQARWPGPIRRVPDRRVGRRRGGLGLRARSPNKKGGHKARPFPHHYPKLISSRRRRPAPAPAFAPAVFSAPPALSSRYRQPCSPSGSGKARSVDRSSERT